MRSAYDIPGSGELVHFSLSIDPAQRARAYVTSSGVQGSFIGGGDMYAAALRYASYLTCGALIYVQRDGTEYVPLGFWNPRRETEK